MTEDPTRNEEAVDESPETAVDVEQEIKLILQKRKRAVMMLIITTVVAFITAIVFSAMGKQNWAPFAAVPIAGVLTSSFLPLWGVGCPACGKPFFAAPARSFFASTCYHCKKGIS